MNKLLVASAGSGKTTHIVEHAIEDSRRGNSVLITTFTEACEREIRDSLFARCGSIPAHITVQTWFSFLITHGVKPFQGRLFQHDVNGMILVSGRSGFRFKNSKGLPVYFGESDFENYFFSPDRRVYSDKLALLVLRCDDAADGRVFGRISRCFQKIYIDEVQDLAGYDLEIIGRLLACKSDVVLVGDPRQATYSTHQSRKHKKYRKAHIVNFFEDNELGVEFDEHSLVVNRRCCAPINEFANSIYPEMPQAKSDILSEAIGHSGMFAVSERLVDVYLEAFQPVQLRENVTREVNESYHVLNFGKSKGLSFDRVLIYPSGPMVKWLKEGGMLNQAPRAKLYVAVTRARKSVGIVLKESDVSKVTKLAKYRPEDGGHGKRDDRRATTP